MNRPVVLAIFSLAIASLFPASASANIYCANDDGVSGERIQAVYGVPAGVVPDPAARRPQIEAMASIIDDAFNASASRQGGAAHPRWVFDQGTCNLSIVTAQLSQAAGATTLGKVIDDVGALGLTGSSDRKVFVWVDGPGGCTSELRADESAEPGVNQNDQPDGTRSMVSMLGDDCWDTDGNLFGPVFSWGMQHEVMHSLGAVQNGAPHAASGHVTDTNDAMTIGGGPETCPVFEDQMLFDCGGDDYFAVSPPCGSYLAENWNTYNSSFLVRPGAPPPETCAIGGKKKTKSKRPRFALSSNRPGTFLCKVDKKKAKPCDESFRTRKLKGGKHRVRVQAVDQDGNTDPSAASKRFRVSG
jgi:hypothetical protein